MRILAVNLSHGTLDAVHQALAGQGYDIVADSGLTVTDVLALSPEVLITEALPSDLTCCGMIAQLRARPETQALLKIVMVVRGGALERARALDLGVNDVISFPFEPIEFAARIRTQFRDRQPEEELQNKLIDVVQKEKYAEVAAESLAEQAVTRRRWLFPAILIACATVVIATLITLLSFQHTTKETLRLRAEIARLNYGLGQPNHLLAGAARTRDSMDSQSRSISANQTSLQEQSKDLRAKMVAAQGSELESLQKQLKETQTRLTLLEDEGRIAETVIRDFGPSVCLLHVTVEFRDPASGQPIRVALDSQGKPQVDKDGMLQLANDGDGPLLRIDVFGTGFLATRDGLLLTNHHVAEPWWKNDDMQELIKQGTTAYVASYEAYFPDDAQGIAAKLGRISPDADVATLQLEAPPPDSAVLRLDGSSTATVRGDAVVLIGYPTGVEGILARAGPDVAQKIAGGKQDVDQIMAQLAAQKLIRPTTTQGHIGDVLANRIVYDAATTSGGSGGPLFNRDGRVIGINFAILTGFGGSNLAVPARYATRLLPGRDAK
ncbi:MAG TPA: trypsin-like peptidase domain-containing protein [Candidatus Acidoferrum sp.]|nr:trypsin-like peptidase domain-containing protein [Candidatus Acidoferrum sp.]